MEVDASVASFLARADAASTLPKLGGMARPNGVVIVSERAFGFDLRETIINGWNG